LIFICFGFFVFYEGFVSGYSVVVFGGSSVSFLPAPGNRHANWGTMTGVGDIGFSQSSTINDIRGHHLLIGVNRLNPSYTDPRAYGLQLRCLSE